MTLHSGKASVAAGVKNKKIGTSQLLHTVSVLTEQTIMITTVVLLCIVLKRLVDLHF